MKSIIALVVVVGLSCCKLSVASGNSGDREACDTYKIVGRAADRVLNDLNAEHKVQLETLFFAESDPLSRYDWLDKVAKTGANAVSQQLLHCEPVDRIYSAIFSDSRWGPRAYISSISQRARREPVDLLEPFIGYMIATLNMRSVPSAPGEGCKAKFSPRGADFSPGKNSSWFRERYLMWVRCADGEYKAFLPESGWQVATEAQLKAIRISNPGA